MKPLSPHDPRNDPFDDLIAAALHGDLTPEERGKFDSRLAHDPAAQAAYLEAQAMHDLLEKTHQSAQPDPAFEQRMVSGVRRKIQTEQHRETPWESLSFFYKWLRNGFTSHRAALKYGAFTSLAVTALFLTYVVRHDIGQYTASGDNGISNPNPSASTHFYLPPSLYANVLGPKDNNRAELRPEGQAEMDAAQKVTPKGLGQVADANMGNELPSDAAAFQAPLNEPNTITAPPAAPSAPRAIPTFAVTSAPEMPMATTFAVPSSTPPRTDAALARIDDSLNDIRQENKKRQIDEPSANAAVDASSSGQAPGVINAGLVTIDKPAANSAQTVTPDTRKLIRNAQLDLEVKSFQAAMDQITALTKSAGGYVDTSNSQKGGNGKLQGTVVVKVLPQNLDDFLLKLRDLGQVQNQSVSTDDVTKDYYDTQARLDNSRRMETQLQDLLKHENSKVSDLLQVERELGRVRGDIEQMQGQLKLYDFQVQYATVTMNMREKDLHQAAAYLLKEQDDFSLFATDVEATFQKARQTADDFKAQILAANLDHNSGSDVSAELTVMVAPDQIEPFLAQVRALGRVANFTRQTQRVANDGGDSDEPADQTLTEKDKVQVHLAIRSDDETRKQVALTVVAKAVDDALDQAKTAALANPGVEILSSSLDKTPQGQSTAELTVRVPGQDYSAVIAAFNALGRAASLSIQRNDDSGPGANGDDAPVIVSLSLTDDDTPLQETALSVIASDVDRQSQQIKKDAAASGVEVKASSFERQPDGTEIAQMTFRLPLSKYAVFLESVKDLGKVESLTVHRDDRPDQTRTDETAPAEITLQVHNEPELVPDNGGVLATLRQTFGEGAAALFSSVKVIGILIAFAAPWLVTLVLLAWSGRRIYIWRKNR